MTGGAAAEGAPNVLELNSIVGQEPIHRTADTVVYSASSYTEEQVHEMLSQIEAKADQLGLAGIQLKMSTLEEVFLNVASGATQINHVLESTGILASQQN